MKYFFVVFTALIISFSPFCETKPRAEEPVTPICEGEDDLKFKEVFFEIRDIPDHVTEALPRARKRLWDDVLWEEKPGLADSIEPTLQKFNVSKKFNVWVYNIYISEPERRMLYLLLENRPARIVMENIPGIDYRWTVTSGGDIFNEPYIMGDLIDITDIDDDGENEIIIQHRVHTGTTENAARYSIYKVISDELEMIFAYNKREILADGSYLVRDVQFLDDWREKVADLKVYHRFKSGKERFIGEVNYTFSKDKNMYLKTKTNLLDKNFDKDLLANGYER